MFFTTLFSPSVVSDCLEAQNVVDPRRHPQEQQEK
jgi:hypothetical protein